MGFSIEIGIDEIKKLKFWRAVLAEFLGTLLFLVCVTAVAYPGASYVDISAQNVEIGIGIGLAIATFAQAFGHVSGGHLNPAVSFGMVLGGRTSILKGIAYIIAQLVGGIAGSAITYGAINDANKLREAAVSYTQKYNLGVTSLANGISPAQGFGLELVFTFVLVFFVFSITDDKKKTEPYGTTLGIGVCIWVCHVCLIPLTGCGINPARSFGPAVVMNSWVCHWVYWVGPLLGGAIAALLYNVIFYVESDSDKYDATEPIPLKQSPSNA